MRFPLHITTDNVRHQVKHSIKGIKRYPFVLMLEPLYTCNLACLGCAVERHTGAAFVHVREPIADAASFELILIHAQHLGCDARSLCGVTGEQRTSRRCAGRRGSSIAAV